MKRLFSVFVFIFICTLSTLHAQNNLRAMVWSDYISLPVKSTDNYLSNYSNEEVLVVLKDFLGNDLYSKIVVHQELFVIKGVDPYNRIPSGVYTVIACSRKELFNQKIVID